MASFTLQWTPIITPNVTGQRAYFRQKSVGGSYLTLGFTPSNDLSTGTNSTVRPGLLDNTIYEFQVANLCIDGGPTFNANGPVELIAFTCASGFSFTPQQNNIFVQLTGIPADINQVRFELTGQVPVTQNVAAGGTITHNFAGLTEDTEYTLNVFYGALVNGVQTFDTSATCTHIIATQAALCLAATGLSIVGQQPNLLWVEGDSSCQTEGGFAVVKTITGVSSPATSAYDKDSNRVYISDLDNATNGNVYWFNPDTATTSSDMVYSSVYKETLVRNTYIDITDTYKRIYFVGDKTGGMRVYDINSNTMLPVVSFGADDVSSFSRTDLWVLGDRIYCNFGTVNMYIIDRATLTLLSSINTASIPTPSHFNSGPKVMLRYGNEIWVAANNASSNGTIGIYNLALTSLIAEITLTGAIPWAAGGSKYWQNIYLYEDGINPSNTRVYASDIGSSKQFLINPATKTVIGERVAVNKENKGYVDFKWHKDPVTGGLYGSYQGIDSSSYLTPINRSYVEDLGNFGTFKNMFENFFIGRGISGITGTSKVVGTSIGLPWSGSGYSTDGTITILDNAAGSNNTGLKIVNTLNQVDGNNNNTPTGLNKPNATGDPDYIAPYQDLTGCAISYSQTCPTDIVFTFRNADDNMNFEFSLPSSVVSNPLIAKIEVQGYNTSTLTAQGSIVTFNAPFTSQYFAGLLTGLTGTAYSLNVRYYNSGNTLLQSC